MQVAWRFNPVRIADAGKARRDARVPGAAEEPRGP
jgi:hypothetical protein